MKAGRRSEEVKRITIVSFFQPGAFDRGETWYGKEKTAHPRPSTKAAAETAWGRELQIAFCISGGHSRAFTNSLYRERFYAKVPEL